MAKVLEKVHLNAAGIDIVVGHTDPALLARHRKRVLHGLRKRAQSLGFDLVRTDTGLVLE